MALQTLTLRVRVRWFWLYAALYVIGLRDLAFRLCVVLKKDGSK